MISSNRQSLLHSPLKSFHQKIRIEKNSSLEYIILDGDADLTFILEENAHLNCFLFQKEKNKRKVHVHHSSPHSSSSIEGIFLLKGQESASLEVLSKHLCPATKSKQYFKAILTEESTAEFLGKIEIAKEASQTSSSQLMHSILLSAKAKIIAEPILIIDNDDVECSHGSTMGAIHEDELFYLESRAIEKEKAKRILFSGLLLEIISKIENEKIKRTIEECLLNEHLKALL